MGNILGCIEKNIEKMDPKNMLIKKKKKWLE